MKSNIDATAQIPNTLFRTALRQHLPCPQCLTLCRVDSFRIKGRGRGKPRSRRFTIFCPKDGRQYVQWREVPKLLEQAYA